MGKIRVGIVFGGRSDEHQVSLMSASSVFEAIDREKYEPVPIGITRDGKWLAKGDPLTALKTKGSRGEGELLPVDILKDLDVVFPVLHGPYGEDGTIQGLFEILDIPYVGAGVIGSAVGMNKKLMKHIFRQNGLPVVNFLAFGHKQWKEQQQQLVARIGDVLGYPCFVKPVNLGSSVGISKAGNHHQLLEAVDFAFQYDYQVIVEEFINCREIECSVLGNTRPRASLPGEVIPLLEFYNYEAKYQDGKSEFLLPAPLTPEKTREVQELALRAFSAVDAFGMARVDFFMDKETGALFVNELNTIPGFTKYSMYPKMWATSGLSYSQLIDELIELALEKFSEKQNLATLR